MKTPFILALATFAPTMVVAEADTVHLLTPVPIQQVTIQDAFFRRRLVGTFIFWLIVLFAPTAWGDSVESAEAGIFVYANQPLHPVSRFLTGACLEDVNHEVYGGIDSQMIFGESFAEPATPLPLKGFSAYEGRWTLTDDGGVQGVGSNGSKIIWTAGPAISEGEVSVDVKLTEAAGGNGGLILKVNDAGKSRGCVHGLRSIIGKAGISGARSPSAELGTDPPRALRCAGE